MTLKKIIRKHVWFGGRKNATECLTSPAIVILLLLMLAAIFTSTTFLGGLKPSVDEHEKSLGLGIHQQGGGSENSLSDVQAKVMTNKKGSTGEKSGWKSIRFMVPERLVPGEHDEDVEIEVHYFEMHARSKKEEEEEEEEEERIKKAEKVKEKDAEVEDGKEKDEEEEEEEEEEENNRKKAKTWIKRDGNEEDRKDDKDERGEKGEHHEEKDENEDDDDDEGRSDIKSGRNLLGSEDRNGDERGKEKAEEGGLKKKKKGDDDDDDDDDDEEEEEEEMVAVLLHGRAFEAQTWIDIGTVDYLSHHHIRSLAIDLPGGKGKTKATLNSETASEHFLERLWRALNISGNSVLVSPSRSGLVSLPFVASLCKPHSVHAENSLQAPSIAGFVPIAPVAVDKYSDRLQDCQVNALIVNGGNDRPQQAERLAGLFAQSKKVIFKNAGHACYMEKPKRFNHLLKEFIKDAIKHKGEPLHTDK